MQDFDALLSSLDIRGVRESLLQMMLQKVEISFKKAVRKKMLHANVERQTEDSPKIEVSEMTSHPHFSIGTDSRSSALCIADSDVSETSTSFVIELGRNKNESIGALRRYQDPERWIWKECCSSSMLCASKKGKKRCKQLLHVCDDCHGIYSSEEDHCPSCHITYGTLKNRTRFSEHVAKCKDELKVDQKRSLLGSPAFPPRIRLLKILLAVIEVTPYSNLVCNLLGCLFFSPPFSFLQFIVFVMWPLRFPYLQKLFSHFGLTAVENHGVQGYIPHHQQKTFSR